MKRALAGALAATAIAVAGTAHAAGVCQWTGTDWACGDGNVFTQHYPQSSGPPNTVITPVATVIPPGKNVPNYSLPPAK